MSKDFHLYFRLLLNSSFMVHALGFTISNFALNAAQKIKVTQILTQLFTVQNLSYNTWLQKAF